MSSREIERGLSLCRAAGGKGSMRGRARGWWGWRCDRRRAAQSEGAHAVAEYPVPFHVLVVGVEHSAILFQPLNALVPADGVKQAGLDRLRRVKLEAPRPLEQVVIDAEVGGFLAPAGRVRGGQQGGFRKKYCAWCMRIADARQRPRRARPGLETDALWDQVFGLKMLYEALR